MLSIELGMAMKALIGDESECGDIYFVKEYDGYCFLSLIDVLGHGAEAREVALIARDYLEHNYKYDLIEIMNGLHEALNGTRGAVVAICRFDKDTGELKFVGIGNITVRIFGRKPGRLISRDGVVGYRITRPQENIYHIAKGDVLLLHSDGIKEHFDAIECKGLFLESAENIVEGIMDRYGKANDDASCVVLKYIN